MLRKFLGSILVSSILIISTSAIAFAADVYITKRGKFYHLAGCEKIKDKKVTVLDELQAQARGLKICPVCDKIKK